ncbi:TPR-like protein [Serendipita vermifera]|nr:TPR-like protein [Serendipita vermifera]
MRSEAPEKLRILSLDGGETRCLSQLHILGEFMHRLNIDTGVERRPCDYFHLIVGTGAGGVISVLLTIFGLDVKEATDTFIRICNAVFPKEGCTPSSRAAKLEAVTTELLEEFKLPPDLNLHDDRNSIQGTCKVAVCYMSTGNLGQCRFLRSYPVRNTASNYNPTVIETLRTAWATPSLFIPVRLGPEYREEEIVSAVHGYNNPTLEAMKEALDVFGSSTYLSCLLSLGTGKVTIKTFGVGASGAGGATGAAAALRDEVVATGKSEPISEPINPISILEQLTTDGERIAEEVSRRIGNLGVYYRFSVTRGLDFDDPPTHRDGGTGNFGLIITHTTAYLLEDGVSSSLDKSVAAAENSGRISLETISKSRSRGLKSSQGLPPLSSFFVMREKPMKFLVERLLETGTNGQRILVLSGLGGSGKTQMALKFARDYEHRYQHIFFIDASTTENIESTMISHVSSLGREYKCSSLKDALNVLANPDHIVTQDWLIIFDSADDPAIDLRDYIPLCEHGSILITTRNLMLGDMSSRRHLKLDVMLPEEAVDTLLLTAFEEGEIAGDEDKKEALAIVEQLGYLPVAITQAGCYIRQQSCLHDYVNRLKENRRKLLERSTRTHRDKLRYRHSVYAAFDVTIDVLSNRARDFLRILSTVHFTNFPLPLIGLAAKGGFAFETNDPLERPPEFKETISLLMKTFSPDGKWHDDQTTDILEELQQYSLVALVPSNAIVTLRLYQAAAVRLISCGTSCITSSSSSSDTQLLAYLAPHVLSLSSIWETLHVNDRASFAQIMRHDGKSDMYFELAKGVAEEVEQIAGRESLPATTSRLDLALAYGMTGDIQKKEEIQREVVVTRETLLGRKNLRTMEAISYLASTIRGRGLLPDASTLQEEVLAVRKETIGEDHLDTAHAMIDLADTYNRLGRFQETESLLLLARDIRTKCLGPESRSTIDVMFNMADCYTAKGDLEKAETIRKEILHLETKRLGVKHVDTIRAMEWMCIAYYNQVKDAEAIKLGEQALILREEICGPGHTETLGWMAWLAQLYHDAGKFNDAKRLREEEIERRNEVVGPQDPHLFVATTWFMMALQNLGEHQRLEEVAKDYLTDRTDLLGEKHIETLTAKSWLAMAYHNLQRYNDAVILRKQEWETRCEVQGEQTIETLHALGWLARAYHEQGRHEEALESRKKELDQRRIAQGESNIDTINTLSWVARAYQELGKHDDAEKLRHEEVEFRKKEQGVDHPDTLDAMSWLSRVYRDQERWVDAEKIQREETESRKKRFGARHTTTLNALTWLVQTYRALGRFSEMADAAEELLEGRKEIEGADHPDNPIYTQWLGEAYFYDGRHKQACPIWEDLVQRGRVTFGEKHLNVAYLMSWLAQCYHTIGLHVDALDLRTQEFLVRGEIQGPLHENTLGALEWIAYEHEDIGQYEDARKRMEELEAKRIEALGPENHDTISTQASLANILEELGQHSKCVEIRRKVLDLRIKVLGPRDPLVALTKEDLAHSLLATGEKEEVLLQASEALKIQREATKPDKLALRELKALIRRINGDPKASNEDDESPIQEKAFQSLVDGDDLVPDPGGDSTGVADSKIPQLPFVLSVAPFTRRPKFGRQPNRWSMFI